MEIFNYGNYQAFEEHLSGTFDENLDDPHELIELLTTNPELTRNQPVSSDFVKCLVFNVVLSGKEKIVEAFLNFFEPEAKNDPQKQLIVAIIKDDIQKVEILLKSGVSLQAGKWEYQYLPAIYSSVLFSNTCNTQNMLTLLIKHGLDTTIKNERNQNLLHAVTAYFQDAMYNRKLEIAKALFDSGVPIDEVDSEGFSPLQYALQSSQNLDLVKFFIDMGANVNRQSYDGNCSSLLISCSSADEAITQLLLSSGADVNAINNSNGRTALHNACWFSSKTKINLLLREGADVTLKDKEGKTPFLLLNPTDRDYDDCLFIMIKEITKKLFSNIYTNFPEYKNDTLLYSSKNSVKPSLLLFAQDLYAIMHTTKSREYFGKCKFEIKKMRDIKFYPPYSYLDLLNISKNIKKLSKLTRNIEFVTEFNANLDSFPYYKEDLIRNFDAAIEVKNDSALVISRLNLIFNGILPDLVIRKVAESLSATDLPEQLDINL